MKKTKTLIVLIFHCLTVFSQDLTLTKTVEGSAMLSFIKQAWDPDGYSFFIDNTRIMKVDATGTRKWEKQLSPDTQIVLRNITYTGAHRFLVTAYHFTTQTLHFFTLDADGTIVSDITAPGQTSYGEHVFIGQDSLLVVGQRNDPAGRSTGFADLFNSKTGSLLWSYTSSEDALGYINATRVTTRTIALYGSKGGSGYGKGALTLIGTDGAEQWTSIYGAASVNTVCLHVTPAHDGTLRALLWKGGSSELITVSPNGELNNTLQLPLTIGRHIIRSTSDHTFIVAGTSRDRVFLACIDENNNILWWRYYGTATRSEFGDAVNGITHHGNASIMLWGASRRDNQSFPYLICTDSQGQVERALPPAFKAPQHMLRHLPGEVSGEPQIFTSFRDSGGNLIVGGSFYKELPGQTGPVACAFASRIDANGDTLWTRDISSLLGASSPYTSYAINSRQTSSGNYVFLVQSRNQNVGSVLVHLDADGNLLWHSTAMSGKRPDLVEISPEVYLVCGHAFDTQKYNETGVLHRIDLKAKSTTTVPVTLPGCMIHNIIPSGKGTYYITGEQIETYKISRKGYWAEIDGNGAVLKSATYDLAYKTMINATATTPAGDILCAGAVEDDKGNRDLLLLMINASGTRLWHKTFDILKQDEAVTLKVLPEAYLVAGETGRQVFGIQESFAHVARFSLQGELAWQQYIGRAGSYTRALDLHLLSDSTALLTGNSENRKDGTPRFESMAFAEKVTFSGANITGVINERAEAPHIYPNPFAEKLQIECATGCHVTLLTIQGQTITHFTVMPQSSPFTLHTHTLPEGLYIADINANGKHYRFRIVK